jgi:hypothetical protein
MKKRGLNGKEAETSEKLSQLIDKLKVDLITAARRVNDNAEWQDVNRNHVNYGIVTQSAEVLRLLGQEIKTPCYGEGEYLKIPKIVINGRETVYHNG